MSRNSKSVKLFNLEERKTTSGAITEIDIFQWQQTLLDNLRREPDYANHCQTSSKWGAEKEINRGFESDEGEDGETGKQKCDKVDSMLIKIASYAPRAIVREITKRSTCLHDIWETAKDWAGIRSTGTKHLDYYKVKNSYQKEDKDETPQEFFYRLKDAMEDTLIQRKDNIYEYGDLIQEDEQMTPTVNSLVVLDWLESLGGPRLIEHVYRIYAKELETTTLASLQNRIWKNLPSLQKDIEDTESLYKISQCDINEETKCRQVNDWNKNKFNLKNRSNQNRGKTKNFSQRNIKQKQDRNFFCKLCKASGSPNFRSHDIAECWLLTDSDRRSITKASAKANALFAVEDDENSQSETPEEESEDEI